MKWLLKLDAWLIAGPYQGLIDLTGKAREWWVEQCAVVTLLTGAAITVMWTTPPFWARCFFGVCYILIALAFFVDSRVPEFMAMTAEQHAARRRHLVVYAILTPTFLMDVDPIGCMFFLNFAGTLSGFYFAACQPPRPREPRRKMAGART